MPAHASPISRREFLYYVWASSMAFFMAEGGGALLWFAVPRFKAGEFGGLITFDVGELPQPGSEPKAYDAGRFWLVNVGEKGAGDPRHPAGFASRPGVVALYKVCVHLGCLYQWKPTNNRFECPCHGSKFLEDGTRVHKPATRNLDQFVVRALDAQGNVLAETKTGDADSDPTVGLPVALPAGAVVLQVDTGKRIRGRRNDGPNTVE